MQRPCFLALVLLSVLASNLRSQVGVPEAKVVNPVVIRRLGNAWFNDGSTRAAFITGDNKRLIRYWGGLSGWDIATGARLGQAATGKKRCVGACRCGANQIVVAWQSDPDGDCEFELVDDTTLKTIRPLKLPATKPVLALIASSDASRIVVCGGRYALCDMKTGEIIREFPARPPGPGPRYMQRFSFSGDGTVLLYIDSQKTVNLFNARDGSPIPGIKNVTASSATLSNDGKTLAAIDDSHLALLDVATGEQLHPAEGDEVPPPPEAKRAQPQSVVAICQPSSPDISIAQSGGPFMAFDSTKRPLGQLHKSSLASVPGPILGFSADGSRVLTGEISSQYRVFDLTTGQFLTPAPQALPAPAFVLVSPDGASVLMANPNTAILRFDISSGAITASEWPGGRGGKFPPSMFGLAYTDQGKSLLLTMPRQLQLRDARTLEVSPQQPRLPADQPQNTSNVVMTSGDGNAMLGVNAKQEIVWIDASSQRQIILFKNQDTLPKPLGPKAISRDGSVLCLQIGPSLRLLDLPAKKWGQAMQIDWSGEQFSVAQFSPDGRWLLDFELGRVAVFSCQDAMQDSPAGLPAGLGQKVRDFFKPAWIQTVGANSADADISSASELLAIPQFTPKQTDSSVQLFELASGRPALSLALPYDPKTKVRFVPHQTELVVVDSTGIGQLWDLREAFKESHPEFFDGNLPDQTLWNKLTDADPSIAFAAGVSLMKREGFLPRVRTVSPLANTPDQKKQQYLQELIAGLGSPNAQEREKSHKELEAAGSSAIPAVRAALAKHPGSELEDRLNDIARLIGADQPGGVTQEDESAADRNDRQLKLRILQLLDWLPDPLSATERKRLAGGPSQP